jgi:hypothetical protein
MSTLKVNTITDTSGGTNNLSIPGAAKAWVNFNGTGTVAIRDSFNVSSITDNGTGDYTMNLTNAMANVNYAITGTVGTIGSTGASDLFLGGGRQTNYSDVRTTGAARFASTNAAGAAEDGAIVSLVVLGD